MKRDDLLLLIDYNAWANARVRAAAARVTPEEYAAPAGLSHGGIRGALVHVVAAEHVWRRRCQEGVSPPALPAEADFPTLEALLAVWLPEERALRAYVAGLEAGQLAGTVSYRTTRGQAQEQPLWPLLVHLVNHGTQFRAEAAVALSSFGQSPGDLDLLLFLRERGV